MKIIALPELCVRPHGASCRRCALACPVDAISFPDDASAPVIDEERCTKCGICMGVCDAFTSSTTNTRRLYEHLRRVAMRGEIVYLTCKENIFPGFKPAENVTVLPCLACIPPELWTLLLAENIPLCVACDLHYCEDCDIAPERGQMLYTHAMDLAQEWTGHEIRYDREIPERQSKADMALERYGRREAFDSLKNDALDVVSGRRSLKSSDALKEMYRTRERRRMQEKLKLRDGEIVNPHADAGRTKRIMMPRRRMLLESIVAEGSVEDAVSLTISATDAHACIENHDCVKVCATGARSISPETGDLDFDPKYCIGCGACVNACAMGAVSLETVSARTFGLSDESQTELT